MKCCTNALLFVHFLKLNIAYIFGDIYTLYLWQHIYFISLATYIPYIFGEVYTLYPWRNIYLISLATCIPYIFGDIYTLYLWRHIYLISLATYIPYIFGDMYTLYLWRHIYHVCLHLRLVVTCAAFFINILLCIVLFPVALFMSIVYIVNCAVYEDLPLCHCRYMLPILL